MRLLHDPLRISATFDDPDLVSRAGLVPVMALAERAGLEALVRRHVTITAKTGVYPEIKAGCLVAGMAAGADSIEDMDLLRHGAMPDLFGGVRAPSTLGSFLRSFTWGNVRQLEAAGRELLAELARLVPLLPGADQLAFVDIDSMQRRVYGHKKQGAAFGHTKISGKTVLVRGLNALAATICTPVAAPVIAGTRLRGGSANTARGAASFTAEAIGAARAAGCAGTIVARADPGFVLRGVRRRLPPRRGVLLGHRPDGPRGHRRDHLDPRGRVDGHQVPAGDLGRSAAGLGVRRRDRRDSLHRVHLQEGPGHHRPADRAPGKGPEQEGRSRPGRAVPGLAVPPGVHRLPVRAGPGRGAAPRPCRGGAGVRRLDRRPACSSAIR